MDFLKKINKGKKGISNNLPSFFPWLYCLESSTDGKINENHGLELLNKWEVCHKYTELNHPLKSGLIVVNCCVNQERLREYGLFQILEE